MKRCSFALFGSLLLAVSAAGQQAANPTNTHPKDNASFGNNKSPKREKAATSRTVTGTVTDQTGQALQGALVTLTDKQTNERTSFFTKKDGHYQFEELSFNKDYEVQARYKSDVSESRKLSQFDILPRPVRMLEIDTHTPTSNSASQSASQTPAAQAPPK